MLDPAGRDEVLATMRDLNRRDGITVVLITHALDELADATRVIAVDAGRIVADGTPSDVIDRADEVPGGRLVRPMLAALARDLRAYGLPIRAARSRSIRCRCRRRGGAGAGATC